ncbi:MAG: hypothetical protein HY040_11720 [Planctomycetes bacterium]|nr:hypothetical protein [Planctomycetota bacterium]
MRNRVMRSRLTTLFLLVGLAFTVPMLLSRLGGYHLPGNQQGYEPKQPLASSHRLHAGDLQISCLYCHGAAEKGRHAGFPASSLCMNCHKSVTAPLGAVRAEDELAKQENSPVKQIVSPELTKLYDSLGLDEKLQRDPKKTPASIPWIRVHNLPAFACFDHRAHVHAGVSCQHCHGPVETMETIRQVERLSMGWCVNCHRDVNQKGVHGKPVRASLDCAACHY